MDQRMVKCGVKNHPLVVCPTGHADTGKFPLPTFTGGSPHLIEPESLLFTFQVFTGIGRTDERDPNLYLNGLTFHYLVRKVGPDIIAGNIASVPGIELPFTGRAVPGCLYTHFTLSFPISGS